TLAVGLGHRFFGRHFVFQLTLFATAVNGLAVAIDEARERDFVVARRKPAVLLLLADGKLTLLVGHHAPAGARRGVWVFGPKGEYHERPRRTVHEDRAGNRHLA